MLGYLLTYLFSVHLHSACCFVLLHLCFLVVLRLGVLELAEALGLELDALRDLIKLLLKHLTPITGPSQNSGGDPCHFCHV